MIRRGTFWMTLLSFAGFATTSFAGLVGHWPLNEGSGSTFADISGAGNDGFLPDGASIEWANDGPPGIQATSVRFTGDQGPSVIETPFSGIGGANPRTITMWMKADPQPMNTAMVSWGLLGDGNKWHFRINQGTNSLRTEFQGGQNFAGTDVADGQWHFVASVFPEGATEGAEILHYLDATLDPQTGGNSAPIDTIIAPAADAFPVHIGWAAGHADRYFVGQIADVRIFDEALDADALQQIMVPEPAMATMFLFSVVLMISAARVKCGLNQVHPARSWRSIREPNRRRP